jgi:hypothetical protein
VGGDVGLSRSTVLLLVLLAACVLFGAAPGSANDGTTRASRSATDTTPPNISLPPITTPATYDCYQTFCADIDVRAMVTVSDPDNTPDEIVVSCPTSNGNQFFWGTAMLTCQAWDPAMNKNQVTTTVTVTVPPPAFQNVPGPITFQQTAAAGAVVTFFPPTAVDVGGQSVPVTCDHLSGIFYPVGTTTVTCTATITRMDSVGNKFTVTSGTVQFTATVTPTPTSTTTTTTTTTTPAPTPPPPPTTTGATTTPTASTPTRDTTAPAISPRPNVTANATSPVGAVLSYAVTATDPDNPAAQIATSCSPASGSFFRLAPKARTKTTTVTCTANDPSGNTATPSSFRVTVLGVHDQIIALQSQVTAATNVATSRRSSLASKLLRADLDFSSGRVTIAASQLTSFIKEAHVTPRLTPAQKATWIRAAARIGAVIGD